MIQNEFSEKLKKLRVQYGLTQRDLGERLGVGKSAVSNYETGISMPDTEKLIAISSLFNVSVDYLLGLNDDTPESFFSSKTFRQDPGTDYRTVTRIPVLDDISGGLPRYFAQTAVDYIALPANLDKVCEYFGLRMNDYSMDRARISQGDTILVRKQQEVNSGDIAVVMIDSGQAIVRKVEIKDAQISLLPQSTDASYLPQTFPLGAKQVTILGKVLSVILAID